MPLPRLCATAADLSFDLAFRAPQHDPIKSIVILKAAEYPETETIAIERQETLKIIARSCHAQYWNACIHVCLSSD
jgi:hypothetical protein